MKRLVFLVTIASAFILYSCDKDDKKSVTFNKLEIVAAELPDSFRLGASYQVMVTYVRPNDCTYFQGFDVYPDSVNTRTVAAIGAYYTDEVCTREAVEVTDYFIFKVIYDQTYKFRFWTGTDELGKPEYMEIEVPVK
jgi:hypothetical protein